MPGNWLAERPDLEPGTNGLARTSERVIGRVAFDWRGETIEVGVMPYRLWLLQKVQDVAIGEPELDALLSETGLSDLATLKTIRRVERINQLEVWTAPI